MRGMATTTYSDPPSPRVGGNNWRQLDVPDLGQWTPSRRVTVVMPYYQAPDPLRLTLAAFANQTYPSELLQVVVVDDGSNPPLELTDDLRPAGLDVTVVHQEDLGFGLARARNTGAKAADGEILIFVDCDMVPEPWHVEAHARWHHATADAVVLGFRRHVEFDGIDVDQLSTLDPAVGLAPLFADRDVQVPVWIDGHMERTDDLTSAHDDLFRPVTGGNLSMRADTYWRVGGSDESFTQWGAEDTELGFRLFTDGDLLIPDRDARCWHQGHGHEPTEAEKASLEDQRAKLAHLIAHRGFRSTRPGRHYVVPRLAVHVPAPADVDRATVVDTVESLLGSRFTDVRVLVELDPDHPDLVWLQRQFEPDPAVEVVLGGLDRDAAVPHAPAWVVVDAGIVVGESTLGTLVDRLTSRTDPVGVVHLTVPGRAPDTPDGIVQAWLTRARRRAERVAGPDEDPLDVAGTLFGEEWMPGSDLGVRERDFELPASTAPSTPAAAPAQLDEVAGLWEVFRELDPAERDMIVRSARTGMELLGPAQRRLAMKLARRLMMLLTALKVLAGARSPGDVVRGLVQVAHAVLPWAVYRALRQLGQPVARRLRRPS